MVKTTTFLGQAKQAQFSYHTTSMTLSYDVLDDYDVSAYEDSIAVANTFIDYAQGDPKRSCRKLNWFKLTKLVHLAHGWRLALYDRPLLDEAIEVKTHGPMIMSVYKARLDKEAQRIKQPIEIWDGSLNRYITPTIESIQIRHFLAFIWQLYNEWSTNRLATLLNGHDSAWHCVTKGLTKGRWQKNWHFPNRLIRAEILHHIHQFEADPASLRQLIESDYTGSRYLLSKQPTWWQRHKFSGERQTA